MYLVLGANACDKHHKTSLSFTGAYYPDLEDSGGKPSTSTSVSDDPQATASTLYYQMVETGAGIVAQPVQAPPPQQVSQCSNHQTSSTHPSVTCSGFNCPLPGSPKLEGCSEFCYGFN